MKVYVDRDDDISREKIEDIIMRAPTYQISDSQYGIGYSDGREVQSKFNAAEKEAIRHAVDKLEYILCIIIDTGGVIQYSDMDAIKDLVATIRDLCKKESQE